MSHLFLVDRRAAPFGPLAYPLPNVLVRGSPRVARRLAGDTADAATVWQALGRRGGPSRGLLLVRWRGLDVDYGPVFRPTVLPDGTPTGFHHRATHPETWSLFRGAYWYASAPAPAWVRALGVEVNPGPADPADDADRLRLAAVLAAEHWAAGLNGPLASRPFGVRFAPVLAPLAPSPAGPRPLSLPGFDPPPETATPPTPPKARRRRTRPPSKSPAEPAPS